MLLNINEVKKITFGAVNVVEEDGFFVFNRFTEKQKECYKQYRTLSLHRKVFATAGVRFSFKSDTAFLKFNFTLDYASSREFAYFDVFVNDKLYAHIGKDTVDESESLFEVELEKGEKKIEIYFPWSMKLKVRNMAISDGSTLVPVKRSKTMIAYGDSITQGYDAYYPSNAYISQFAKALDADLYNKAIGGDTFFPELLEAKDGFIPDIVTVAYGTNDWMKSTQGEFIFNAKTFFELLYENYKSSKIYVITPLWRKDSEDGSVHGVDFSLSEHREFIKNVALSYDNVTVIDGDDLVPHDEIYFSDKRLHPNDEGFKLYAENLIKAIKNVK